MQSMAMQEAESAHNPEDIAMLRMAMPPEPADHQCAAFGGAMVGAEGAGHADHGAPNAPSHGLRPIKDRTQTMPSKPFPTDIGKTLAAQIIAVAGSTKGLRP
jgi:hypothetical protein